MDFLYKPRYDDAMKMVNKIDGYDERFFGMCRCQMGDNAMSILSITMALLEEEGYQASMTKIFHPGNPKTFSYYVDRMEHTKEKRTVLLIRDLLFFPMVEEMEKRKPYRAFISILNSIVKNNCSVLLWLPYRDDLFIPSDKRKKQSDKRKKHLDKYFNILMDVEGYSKFIIEDSPVLYPSTSLKMSENEMEIIRRSNGLGVTNLSFE